jgi:hypothetical protein
MELRVLSKKTRGGLFLQFDIVSPGEEAIDQLLVEPPGAKFEELTRMEEELRASGEICESPDTGFSERIEPMSDASYCTGGYFEVRDAKASEALVARLSAIFPRAQVDVEEE